ncbi:MAG: ABC transporter permease [Spirochaetota bacterium]
MNILTRLYNSLKEIIETINLMFNAIVSFFTRWYTGGLIVFEATIDQIWFTGIKGMHVIGMAGIGLGLIVSTILLSFGLPVNIVTSMQGQILTLVIIRELGPLLTALIIISRSGTAITTEIGNMNANKEFDALTSMGIDVIHFVVSPRIIGMVIAVISLNIYLCFLSVITSAVVFNFNNVSYNIFFNSFFDNLEFSSVFITLIKAIGFGFIISSISCYQGYRKPLTFTDVPRVLTKSTGKCIIWCFLYYAFITILSYL